MDCKKKTEVRKKKGFKKERQCADDRCVSNKRIPIIVGWDSARQRLDELVGNCVGRRSLRPCSEIFRRVSLNLHIYKENVNPMYIYNIRTNKHTPGDCKKVRINRWTGKWITTVDVLQTKKIRLPICRKMAEQRRTIDPRENSCMLKAARVIYPVPALGGTRNVWGKVIVLTKESLPPSARDRIKS